jgi:hypothetical protein
MVEIVNPIGDGGMIGHQGNFLLLWSLKFILAAQVVDSLQGEAGSLFDHLDCDFRTVGLGEPCLIFKPLGNGAVADFVRMAEFVELEQFRRQRLAAGMSLALFLIDMYFQFSGHPSVPLWSRLSSRLCVFLAIIAVQALSASAQIVAFRPTLDLILRNGLLAASRSSAP